MGYIFIRVFIIFIYNSIYLDIYICVCVCIVLVSYISTQIIHLYYPLQDIANCLNTRWLQQRVLPQSRMSEALTSPSFQRPVTTTAPCPCGSCVDSSLRQRLASMVKDGAGWNLSFHQRDGPWWSRKNAGVECGHFCCHHWPFVQLRELNISRNQAPTSNFLMI